MSDNAGILSWLQRLWQSLTSRVVFEETLTIAPGATDATASLDLDAKGIGHFVVAVISDEASATDGLRLQYSLDDITWYTDGAGFTHSTGIRRFPAGALAKYFRVQFEAASGNGGDATVDIQVVKTTANSHEPQHRINDDVSPDRSTLGLVKAALTGYDSVSQQMKLVPTDALGNLEMSVSAIAPQVHGKLLGADSDTFGTGVVTPRVNRIDVQFHDGEPEDISLVYADTGSGSSSKVDGVAVLSSGTDTDMEYTLLSDDMIEYNSGHEIFLLQTIAWTVPPTSASDIVEIGLCEPSTPDGYTWAYKGTSWGIRYTRNGSEVSFTPASSFSEDRLDANTDPDVGPVSTFTRDGVAEAIDLTKINVFRIRFGWLSAAPTHFEVLAPDGHWVLCHLIKHPNASATAQTVSPNLPALASIRKVSSDATDIQVVMGCWGGGINVNAPVGESPDGAYIAQRSGGLHTANSDSTPRLAGEVYRGEWFQWAEGGYSCLVTDLQSDVNATFYVDFSDDKRPTNGDDSSVDDSVEIAYTGGQNFRRVTPVQSRWARHRVVNGVVDQTTFNIQAVFLTTPVPLVMNRLDEVLEDAFLGGVVTSAHQAKDSSGDYGPIGRGGVGDGLDSHVTDSEPRAVRKPMTREQVTTVDLTTTSQQIDTSPLTSRSGFLLLVDGTNTKDVHINFGSAATTSSPRLSPGDGLPLLFDETVTIHGRSNTGTQRVYLIEGGEPL